MKRFIEGEDRRQATLLPDCLEDYVSDENPVRVIEAFIDELDLKALTAWYQKSRDGLLIIRPRC